MGHVDPSPPGPASTGESDVTPGVWCIVVAGGSGNRFGGLKQFEELAGRRVIDWAVSTASKCCEGVVVVVPGDFVDEELAKHPTEALVVAGGASRAESVRAGLDILPESAEFVLVHDGARPAASVDLFRRVIDALVAGADGVVPVVPVPDTLRSIHGGIIDRDSVRAVQTPQGFPVGVLVDAHSGLGDATDDAGLVEALGRKITLVAGERANLKVTEPFDLAIAEVFLKPAR